jgi:hypothetical protein
MINESHVGKQLFRLKNTDPDLIRKLTLNYIIAIVGQLGPNAVSEIMKMSKISQSTPPAQHDVHIFTISISCMTVNINFTHFSKNQGNKLSALF